MTHRVREVPLHYRLGNTAQTRHPRPHIQLMQRHNQVPERPLRQLILTRKRDPSHAFPKSAPSKIVKLRQIIGHRTALKPP